MTYNVVQKPLPVKEDPHTFTVNTALSLALSSETGIVVGEDVDVLVILIGLCGSENVFFFKHCVGHRFSSNIFSTYCSVFNS